MPEIEVSEFRPGMPAPDLHDVEVVSRHARNSSGRDFVVGDIHGMFAHLRALLARVEFDVRADRLFSVGDLVDRGPDSLAALEWLDADWFHACRGNHEQFAIDSEDAGQLEVWVRYNGGDWWLDLDDEQRVAIRERFRVLPVAMEVETDSGAVGIVHADVPPLISWDQFMKLLEARDRDATFYALWSRNRVTGGCTTLPVRGAVDRVYCGHTPTRSTVQIDNVHYIDTGAVYCLDGYEDARLTIVEIHPDRHREFAIYTNETV